MDYVVFSSSSIMEFFSTIYFNLGSIINISFWIFIILAGIYAVHGIVSNLGS